MSDRLLGGEHEPMSNHVGVDGNQLSVADILFEQMTGRPFVPKIGGPRTAGEQLDIWQRPTD